MKTYKVRSGTFLLFSFELFLFIILLLFTGNIQATYQNNAFSPVTPTNNQIKEGIKIALECIDNSSYSKDDKIECIHVLNEKKFRPAPEIALPILIKHLKNDNNFEVRLNIANMIINIGQNKEVVEALKSAANEPLSESSKIKLETIPHYETQTLQGTALGSLAALHNEESIPLMMEWLLDYGADLFMFAEKINHNKIFNKKVSDEFDKKFQSKINNKQKLRLIKSEIFWLNQNIDKYEQDISNVLDDNDASTRTECLTMLLELKQYKIANDSEVKNLIKLLRMKIIKNESDSQNKILIKKILE